MLHFDHQLAHIVCLLSGDACRHFFQAFFFFFFWCKQLPGVAEKHPDESGGCECKTIKLCAVTIKIVSWKLIKKLHRTSFWKTLLNYMNSLMTSIQATKQLSAVPQMGGSAGTVTRIRMWHKSVSMWDVRSGLDNFSRLPPWLSDPVSMIRTGDVSAPQQYTNSTCRHTL